MCYLLHGRTSSLKCRRSASSSVGSVKRPVCSDYCGPSTVARPHPSLSQLLRGLPGDVLRWELTELIVKAQTELNGGVFKGRGESVPSALKICADLLSLLLTHWSALPATGHCTLAPDVTTTDCVPASIGTELDIDLQLHARFTYVKDDLADASSLACHRVGHLHGCWLPDQVLFETFKLLYQLTKRLQLSDFTSLLFLKFYVVVYKKTYNFYFLNSFVKHWPILTIFGMRHQQRNWCKWF